MKQVNLRDANQQFSKLVREVEENGETFVVIRNGAPAAELGPVQSKQVGRRVLTAAQEEALNSLIEAARNSTAKSSGRRWTREELYERD